MFRGILTALITPFKDGALDLPALVRLTERQLDAGVHGLVPLGSTGESATLTFEERAEVIRTVIETARGRVPVIVGAGTNDTRTTIENVKQAQQLGATAAMAVTPYYNRPTPAGYAAHLDAVHAACDIPLVLYNVPSRTGTNLAAEHAIALAQRPYVIGLKEASGNMLQVQEILAGTEGLWDVLSGEDALTYATLAAGGQGVICTASNTDPVRFVALYDAFTSGRWDEARRLQYELLPLIRAHFTVANPIPVKAAASLLGLCRNELRLPLLPLESTALANLAGVLDAFGLREA